MTATLERATLPPGTVTARLNGREFPTRGQHVIDFIETACVLTKDQWRGQPFTLEPWQKRLLYEAFELNPDTGLRRYRTIYIEVPKKQGKSELLAALCAYLLVADNTENPEIACGSNSEEQADLVFGAAKAMCELSPVLSPLVTCYRRQLVLRENPAAKIIRVSAKAKTNDGRNLSAVVEDELHEYDESGEQLHNVLTNGVATRRQPLNLMITTAGWDLETLCGRMHLHAQRVISGEVVDPTFYAKIYAAGVEDVNLDDVPALERALRAANPSYGVTVQLPFYLDQRRKGAANFKRYYLNIWTSAESQWLPDGAWDECAAAGWDFDPALPMYVGFDASTRRDSTAIVMTQKDDAGLVSVRGKAWERPIEPNTGKPVENWRVPKEEIKTFLRDLCRDWDVRAVAYDPWSFAWTADELEAEGIPMIEVPQVPSRLAPATQGLYELIVDRLLRHDGDPVFARHIRNAVPKKVDRGYILDKFRGRANDLAAALVTVTYELMQREEATEEAPAPSILFFDDEEVA
jgi:phage terminase large subunit-like protein